MDAYGRTGDFMGYGAGTGYHYDPKRTPQPEQRRNVLTQDEIQKLIKKEGGLSLQLTETDVLRAACNHRTADGSHDTLREDEDGRVVCEICQYRFLPLDAKTTTNEEIQSWVDNIIDTLQTIKLLYINMPDEVSREYFQIIPLIEKMPKLFEFAAKNYMRHNSMNPYGYNDRNMNAINIFQMLAGGGAQMWNNPQPQQYPNTNGFGYSPQTSGYSYTPNVTPNASSVTPTTLPSAPVTEAFKA